MSHVERDGIQPKYARVRAALDTSVDMIDAKLSLNAAVGKNFICL